MDLGADAATLAAATDVLDGLRSSLAKFDAGEQAVTEALAPLAQVVEPIEDQLFLTSQLYEEAKHADFSDRYWRAVVQAAEDELGLARTDPTDPAWFNEDNDELFARTTTAMERLLDDDTPENRAHAYCHYHLVVEGVLAQTGYYGLTRIYGGEQEEVPKLPGLVEEFWLIRGDEGRHVGFGMAKLAGLVEAGVDPEVLSSVTGELVGLVQGAVHPTDERPEQAVLEPGELASYAAEKHAQRLRQITDSDLDVPDVEELTRIDE